VINAKYVAVINAKYKAEKPAGDPRYWWPRYAT
jgi:hypothetical protein